MKEQEPKPSLSMPSCFDPKGIMFPVPRMAHHPCFHPHHTPLLRLRTQPPPPGSFPGSTQLGQMLPPPPSQHVLSSGCTFFLACLSTHLIGWRVASLSYSNHKGWTNSGPRGWRTSDSSSGPWTRPSAPRPLGTELQHGLILSSLTAVHGFPCLGCAPPFQDPASGPPPHPSLGSPCPGYLGARQEAGCLHK